MKQVTLVEKGQNSPSYQGQVDDDTAFKIMEAVEGGMGLALPLGEGSWAAFGAGVVAAAVVHITDMPPQAAEVEANSSEA